MRKLDALAGALLVVGGLNWGLVALARFDLVAAVVGLDFGQTNPVSRLVYGLVGLSAAYLATQLPALRRRWSMPPPGMAHETRRDSLFR
jgi:uncharacterized membrane protein YuzA (DUF378 family)